jgi:acetyl/propionyl-CoA carboxylase alpha subunit
MRLRSVYMRKTLPIISLPDIGTLANLHPPAGQWHVRVDDGFEQGMSIPFYYDPMIAKLICHAETRERVLLIKRSGLLRNMRLPGWRPP